MTALHDKIRPKWIRLLKGDRHLGGLYDPQRGIIRFIGNGGTVDYDLVAMAEEAQRQAETSPPPQ